MNPFRWIFSSVTYTCHPCGARQRIPLRRVHAFERFHHLEEGEALLIACPHCQQGIQTPSSYRTHTGHAVVVDPRNPPDNAFLHAFY
jgi:RNase P subunit RPR2